MDFDLLLSYQLGWIWWNQGREKFCKHLFAFFAAHVDMESIATIIRFAKWAIHEDVWGLLIHSPRIQLLPYHIVYREFHRISCYQARARRMFQELADTPKHILFYHPAVP